MNIEGVIMTGVITEVTAVSTTGSVSATKEAVAQESGGSTGTASAPVEVVPMEEPTQENVVLEKQETDATANVSNTDETAVTDEAAATGEVATDPATTDETAATEPVTDEAVAGDSVATDIQEKEAIINAAGGGTMKDGMSGGYASGEGMLVDPAMGMGVVKDPLLSSWPFVIGISGAVLFVSVVFGVLLAKRKIKKGIELYED